MHKDGEGRYYYSIDGVYYYLPAGMEGEIMAQKQDTAKAIVKAVQSLATATDSAGDLEAEYFDAAGAGWVDADVVALGITAAQLAGCITLLQQVDKLMTGVATTPAVYRSTLNQVRRVQA